MTRSHLVLTAGISAFSGANLGSEWLTPLSDRLKPTRPAIAGVDPSDEAALLADAARLKVPTIERRGQVCAEFSLLEAMRRAGQLSDAPRVDLIHTSTFAGRLAATFIQKVIEADSRAHVTLHAIDDLDASRPDAMRKSLGTFMGVVAKCLQAGSPYTTAFAPIGGYKVMTSLGYLTGAMLGYDTLYTHEVGQQLITVPAVPFDISFDALRAARPLVWRLLRDDVVPASQLHESERTAMERAPWLVEHCVDGTDDLLSLSPLGHFLRTNERYRDALLPEVKVAAHLLKAADQAPLATAVSLLVDEIAEKKRDTLLYHERDYRHHGTPWHAWRTASDGKYRLIWRWTDHHVVAIREAWIDDHAAYERAVQRGDILEAWDGVLVPWDGGA